MPNPPASVDRHADGEHGNVVQLFASRPSNGPHGQHHPVALDAWEDAWLRGLRPRSTPHLLSLASVALSVALYTTIWGLGLAVGLVAGMYAHELGHIVVLRYLRVPCSPPMFVPFIGAVVRVERQPESATDHAFMALAGPAFGLIFSLLCMLGHALTGAVILHLLAVLHAMLNLVNMLPLARLDAGLAFLALDRRQRWYALAAPIAIALTIGHAWPLLLALSILWSATRAEPPREGNAAVLVSYIALLLALCSVAALPLYP